MSDINKILAFVNTKFCWCNSKPEITIYFHEVSFPPLLLVK